MTTTNKDMPNGDVVVLVKMGHLTCVRYICGESVGYAYIYPEDKFKYAQALRELANTVEGAE